MERRYAQLLDGEQEAFQDSRAAFSQALETILSSPLAADGLVLDAVDRQDPSDIPAALGRIWTGGSWRCCGSCRTGSRRRCGCCRRRTAF